MNEEQAATQVAQYGGYAAVAFLASFMRASKWKDDATGKIIWFRVWVEIPSSVAVGVIAAAVGEWRHWDPQIIGGISGFLGLLGAPFFSALGDVVISGAKAAIKAKFGGT